VSEPASRLERIVRSGRFCVTAEVVPPRSAAPSSVAAQARALVGYADAVNVTDNPTSSAHMSPVAGAAILAESGIEPTMQITCRDRNRLGLTSDLLGGWALGARNLFCLTGDPIAIGDHPDARAVHDLAVADLVRLAAGLREEGRLLSGATIDSPPRYFIGVAELPLAEPYDPARLDAKLAAGAHFVMTQIVYDLDAFSAWADAARARGVFDRVAVIVGVAPLRGARQARYMNDHLPGVTVPDAVVRALEAAGPDAEAEGVRLATDIVEGLRGISGVSGVHVMGLGREEVVRRVIEGAGLLPRPTGST
jgi:methylenetetrahydrofolate reductase (NADPH)